MTASDFDPSDQDPSEPRHQRVLWDPSTPVTCKELTLTKLSLAPSEHDPSDPTKEPQ
jgi:hypothetical protein